MNAKSKVYLIVDDEPTVCQVLSDSIQDEQCVTVHHASNGKEAFDLILDNFIDIVITDLCMEDGSGFDLIKNINTLPPDDRPLVYVISGLDKDSEHFEDITNIEDYFQKPFRTDHVARKIKKKVAS